MAGVSLDNEDEALDCEASYTANLNRSLSLVLDTFYENLTSAATSCTPGALKGFEDLVLKIEAGIKEYQESIRPEILKTYEENKNKKAESSKNDKLLDSNYLNQITI